MALNIAYNQSYDFLADKSVISLAAQNILKNAETKNSSDLAKSSIFDINFAANDAVRQAVISNAGLQITLDANLKETLKFLNSEAAKKMSATTSATQIIETSQTSEKESYGSQNKYYGELLELLDYEIDENAVNIFAV